jgi:hypothetical protein
MEQNPELTGNHIHAHSLDVLSALRITQLRHQQGRHCRPDIKDRKNGYLVDNEMLIVASNLEAKLDEALKVNDHKIAMRLNDLETIILSHALSEAYFTALDDQMPRTADSLLKLHEQVSSGRSSMILVFGSCYACWPKQRKVDETNAQQEQLHHDREFGYR